MSEVYYICDGKLASGDDLKQIHKDLEFEVERRLPPSMRGMAGDLVKQEIGRRVMEVKFEIIEGSSNA
jgi:hypothetical protein